jgi:hypothetical protein
VTLRVFRFAVLLLLAGISSCRQGPGHSEPPLARAHDRYLYPSDVASLINPGTSPEDSARLVQDYIDTWIKHHLLLQVASVNLGGQLSQIDRQARDYRENLLIEAYLQEWADQNLDTVLPMEQIAGYYAEHQEQFRLQTPVYRVDYLIAEKENMHQDSVRLWFRNLNRYQRNLDRYCLVSCIDCGVDVPRWFSLEELRRNFPGGTLDLAELESGAWLALEDQNRVSLIRMRESMPAGALAPLAYCRNDISKRLLNKRKRDLIKATYRDLYIEGSKREHFEIFAP